MSTFDFTCNHHLDLPDDVFRLMRDQIYKRTGCGFADSSKYLLQKRLSPRARELNFDSFQKYFYFLQYDPRAEAEFDQIYDLVTTNETYFFREPAQLAAFAKRSCRRCWSARRSKENPHLVGRLFVGEEPYSIAMLLARPATTSGPHSRFSPATSTSRCSRKARRKGTIARARSGPPTSELRDKVLHAGRRTAPGTSTTRSATGSRSAA